MDVIDEIRAERERQKDTEGWTPKHDDGHANGELALLAGCYCESSTNPKLTRAALGLGHPDEFLLPKLWPWKGDGFSLVWWKPKDPRSDLIRAAALLVAEIERRDRASSQPKEG